MDPSAGEPPFQPGKDTVANGSGLPEKTLPEPPRTINHVDSDPAGPEAAAAWSAVPGYEILGVLGRGGMGVVYRAMHVQLKRLVALKVLLSGSHTSPGELVRFRQEAELVARLQHPNVVQVHEIGTHEGRPYLALEYVAGPTLAQRRAAGPLPPHEAAGLVETLARAVAYAHRQGVLHRDLKPANVLLTPEGTPKLTDFGLARRVESDSGLTATGAILGTPNYMAPEQADSKPELVGPPADLYALGAILYDLLTGRPPFQGTSTLETLELVRRQEPVPPARLQPKVPRDLETICLKCLRKEPARRYTSGDELADDLERFLAGRPVLARPTGWAERTWRWCQRNPVVAAMTAALALALVVIAGGSLFASWRLSAALSESDVARGQADQARAQAEADRDRARAAEEDGLRQLFQSYEARARAERSTHQIGQRVHSLEAVRKAVDLARRLRLPPERLRGLRDEAVAALALPADLRPAEWVGRPDGVPGERFCFDIDTRGARYAVTTDGGAVFIGRAAADRAGLKEATGVPPSGGRTWVWWSNDGRYVVVTGDHFRVWQVDGAEPRLILEEKDVSTYDFTSDGRQFYLIRPDGNLRLFALPSGKPLASFKVPAQPSASKPHPTRPLVAVGTARGIYLFDLPSGQQLGLLPPIGHVGWVTWHPDGEVLATSSLNRIVLWDVPRQKKLRELEHETDGLSIAFSPAGDVLASQGWDGKLILWDPRSGRPLFRTATRPTRNSWLRFCAGNRLAMPFPGSDAGGAWRLTEVVTSRTYGTLVPGRLAAGWWYGQVSVRHDGRLLAVSVSGGVSLFDLVTGTELGFLPFREVGGGGVLFEPEALGGALLTNGPTGVRRWPIRPDSSDPAALALGPPENVAAPVARVPLAQSRDGQLAQSRDGLTLAAVAAEGAVVWRRDSPDEARRLKPHPDCGCVDLSPDGTLAATSSLFSTRIKVWDVATCDLVRELPGDVLRSQVRFSPDGRWLHSSGGRRWAVGTWAEGPPLPAGRVAFSPDGGVLALGGPDGSIRLFDAGTAREFVRLPDPRQAGTTWLAFSPDGARLVATSNDTRAAHVWDLRQTRRELAELGLDWEGPAYPTASLAGPLRLHLRAEAADRGGE
jgi:WD40 repeat protein